MAAVGHATLGAKPGDWVRRHADDAHPYDSGWAFT
jgi:hypothetical protein